MGDAATRSELLPDDVLLHVARYCCVRDVAAMSAVSKQWNCTCTSEALWQLLTSLWVDAQRAANAAAAAAAAAAESQATGAGAAVPKYVAPSAAPAVHPRAVRTEGRSWREFLVCSVLTDAGWPEGRRPDTYTMTALRGHTDYIVEARPMGGSRLCTASADGTLRLWERTEQSRPARVVRNAGGAALSCLQVDPARGAAYFGDARGFVSTCDAESGRVVLRRRAAPAASPVAALALHRGNDLLGAAHGSCVSLWDARVPAAAGKLAASDGGGVFAVRVGAVRAVACTPGQLYVWDVRKIGGAPLFKHPTDSQFTCLSCDPLLSDAVVGQASGQAIVFSQKHGLVQCFLPNVGSSVSCVDAVNGVVAVGGHGGEVLLVASEANSTPLRTLRHHGKVNTVRVQHGALVSASADGSVVLCPTARDATPFDLRAGSARSGDGARNPPHPSRPFASAAMYDGSHLTVTCNSIVRTYAFPSIAAAGAAPTH